MTTLPRAATAPELVLLRSDNQSSRVYITVHQPATVYSARLAAVPSTTDQVTSITYNSGSGTHTDILADQTLYVGTSAGAYDLGMCRIRNLTGIGATSGTFQIAEESEIDWQASAYLTVKDEFAIWPRHIRLQGTTPYMDYDVAYASQNSLCDSIPVMGPHRVLWLENGATSVSTTLDGSDSWALNNSITDYLWACATASATADLDTATPTLTFNTYGVHRVSLTITNDDAATFTGYRFIFVVKASEALTGSLSSDYILSSNFTIDSLAGDYDSGGWSAQVTMYDGATRSDIRDRALVIIHTRDTYGSSGSSVGFISGAENILFVGWIAGETIRRAPDDLYGSVSFTIEGPQYWLGRIPAFPAGMKDRTSSPTKWTRFQGLTAKATVWHLLHWRSTITRCTDVFPLDNAWRAARIEAPGAQTLWEQLKTIEYSTVLAEPCGDRFGRLHNQVNQQLLDDTARGNVADVMTLTGADLSGDVEIERSTVDNASIVDLSGFAFDGTTGSPFFSLSPGRVFRNYGSSPEVVDRLVLYDQATTNTLCGRFAGWRNNEYPRISVLLASNHRLIDIAPYSFYAYAVAAADSPRGIAETLQLIPRRITFEYDNDGGYFLVRAVFENEAEEELAITGDAPVIIPDDPPPPPPPIDPPPPPVVNSDAQIMWMIHSDNTLNANPPIAVIYEKLDDLTAPVYVSMTPPAALNIVNLSAGTYDAVTDTLMLIGFASSTPTIPGTPGWNGAQSEVILRVAGATGASPTWTLEAWGYGGCPGGSGCSDEGAVALMSAHNFTRGNRILYAVGRNYSQGICIVYINHDYNAINGSYATNCDQVFNNGNQFLSMGWAHDYITSYDGNGNLYIPITEADWNTFSDSATWEYQPRSVKGAASGDMLYFVRRNKSTEAFQIASVQVDGIVGGSVTPDVELTLDETSGSGIVPLFANTLNVSDYVNVCAYSSIATCYIYYRIGTTWAKATGTVPYGIAHYMKRAGGNSILLIQYGMITNGNEFARYTADLTDITSNPWSQLTGNMWSGAGKIMQSGNLSIVDSWLSF